MEPGELFYFIFYTHEALAGAILLLGNSQGHCYRNTATAFATFQLLCQNHGAMSLLREHDPSP
jgi:hypothetical protein